MIHPRTHPLHHIASRINDIIEAIAKIHTRLLNLFFRAEIARVQSLSLYMRIWIITQIFLT